MNPYLPHVIELRFRLIRGLSVTLAVFLILFWQDAKLYSFVAQPLLLNLPLGSRLIATEVTSPFTVPMKLALITAILMTVPFLLFELWSFVAPGLHRSEKRTILPMVTISTLLFYLGCGFSYTIICPMTLKFFTHTAPKEVLIMTDIRHYLDFMLTLIFAGGLSFQVPIITLACIKTNIVSTAQLAHLRPYIIVLAFVLGMLLTPPDVISQILLALPMWGLFEGGLLVGKYLEGTSKTLKPFSKL